MTEVPEYLLARSRERRAAIGGGGDTGAESAGADTAAPASSDVPAAAPAPVAPAAVEPAEPPAPEPVPPFVEAAQRRKKIPLWVVPAMLFLPIWAFYYVGTLERPPAAATGLLGSGEQVFAASCSGCHGATGGGGVGPQLSDGEVLLTFPDLPSHISWVITGSPDVNGTPYGNPNRDGGQQMSQGGMPAWAGSLSSEELLGVVLDERIAYGGLDAEEAAYELELLEAYLDTGVEFGGDETPRDISDALSQLDVQPAGDGEAAAG